MGFEGRKSFLKVHNSSDFQLNSQVSQAFTNLYEGHIEISNERINYMSLNPRAKTDFLMGIFKTDNTNRDILKAALENQSLESLNEISHQILNKINHSKSCQNSDVQFIANQQENFKVVSNVISAWQELLKQTAPITDKINIPK